jgi:phage terminase large subunit GpA-like protein
MSAPTKIGSRPDWVAQLCDEVERRALMPPERTDASTWATRHRRLSRRQSPRRPGPWRDENQPILRGIMQICARRSVREIWIKKSGQLGVSEAIRNEIGRRADQDPLPLMLVLPNQIKGREIIRTRIIPLFEDTERLRALMTGRRLDMKLTAITLLNGFDLRLAWSGSATSLASDPIAVVILDEVDKFEQLAGREADPVDLARTRLRTLEKQKRSLLVALSTPTTDDGPIAVGYDDCPAGARLFYFVPCPHCGTFQRLVFDRLKFEKFTELIEPSARANAIKHANAAWFECENPRCAELHPAGNGRFDESHKRQMLLAGYWGTTDGSWKLFFDGREEGTFPTSERIGVHAPALYDIAITWASIAAEFVAADGRAEKLQHFYNSTLAETWKITVSGPATSSVFEALCRPNLETGFTPPPAKIIPIWASRLLMTVDTQKDHFYFVIRAWGPRFRSQRIHHGKVVSFADLEELFYRAYFPYEGGKYAPMRCYRLGIDSGGGTEDEQLDANRTEQVYRWCLTDPLYRLPLKGSKPIEPRIRWRQATYTPPNQKSSPFDVRLWLWDGTYFRDLLDSYINTRMPVIDRESGEVLPDQFLSQWALNDDPDPDYCHQLSNVSKTRRRKGRSYVETWTRKTAGARKDYHDCEAEQIMMAHGPGDCLALLTPEEMIIASRRPAAPASGGITMPDGRPFLATQR